MDSRYLCGEGWDGQECNPSRLHDIQPLITVRLPSQTLVIKWVWTEILFAVNRLGSEEAGVRLGWGKAAGPLPGHGQPADTWRGFLVPSPAPLREVTL